MDLVMNAIAPELDAGFRLTGPQNVEVGGKALVPFYTIPPSDTLRNGQSLGPDNAPYLLS